MKPNFALSLSFDKVELLHRDGTGWVSVGDVQVDTDDLDGALAALRQKALLLDPDGLRSKLILPDEQVKFLGIAEADADDAAVRAALDGATPYAVDDLVYEFAKEGRRTLIAAVARETLEEAEAFALAHHFAPVSIVAKSVKGRFDGEPYFGMTRAASILLADGDSVERDNPPAAIRKAIAKAAAVEAKGAEPKPAPTASTPPVETAKTANPDLKNGVTAPSSGVTAPTADDKASAPTDIAPTATEPVFAARARSVDAKRSPLESAVVSMKGVPATGGTAHTPDDVKPAFKDGVSDRLAQASQTDLSKSQPFPSVTDPKSPDPLPDDNIKPGELAATLERTPSQPIVPTMNEGGGGLFATRRAPGAVSKPLSGTTTETPTPVPTPKPRTGSTVFDQKAEEARKKPKYTWLILTVLLLLAMLLIALFSNVFEGDGTTDSAAAPAPLVIEQPVSDVAALAPVIEATPSEVTQTDPLILAAPDVTAPLPLPDVPAFEATPRDVATDGADPDVAAQIFALVEATSQSGTPLAADVIANPAPPARGETAATQDIVTPDTPTGTVPSPDEAIAFYNATGVWLRAPRLARPATSRTNGAVSTGSSAAITRPELAAALPPISTLFPDTIVAPQTNPPGPNVVFARDARGFFQATPSGTRAPSGMLIYAGSPTAVPPTRPGTIAPPIQRVSVTPTVRNAQNTLEDGVAEDALPDNDTAEVVSDILPSESDTPAEPAIDARGLIVATADGAVSPDGLRVFAGLPDIIPPNRPDDLAAQTQTLADEVTAVLGSVALAPDAINPQRAAFAGPRPGPRPESLVPADQEAIASAIAQATQNPEAAGASVAATLAAIVSSAPDPLVGATSQAVARARLPEPRPRNFDRVVASAQARQASLQTTAPAAPSTPRAAQPDTVSSAPAQPTGTIPRSVAAAATVENAIRLRDINLISVAGRPGDRRALIRMPNGQFLRVQVGDALDGGRVTAIGDNVINYVRRGNTIALGIPG